MKIYLDIAFVLVRFIRGSYMSFVCTAKSLGRIFRGVSCAPAAVEFGTVLLGNVLCRGGF